MSGYRATSRVVDSVRRVEYRPTAVSNNAPAVWTFEFTANKIVLTSEWSLEATPAPVVFNFNLAQARSTVLGLFTRDGLLSTPALMHFPEQGSIRLSASIVGRMARFAR